MFNEGGDLIGRYDTVYHGTRKIIIVDPDFNQEEYPDDVPPQIEIDNPDCKIPAAAIEVDDVTFQRTIDEQDGIWKLINQEVVKKPLPEATIEQIRDSSLRAISNNCDAEINAIKAGYPANEVLSWDKQEQEARAFVADANAATPLLDALSLARGIDKAELTSRVIQKADAFSIFTGALIGKRQKLEDQMASLFADPQNPPTIEQVRSIDWY